MKDFKTFNASQEAFMSKVWKDFTRITTNRPDKKDIPTLHYSEKKDYIEINWGDYAHLGGARFKDSYFTQYEMNRYQFMDWLDSQGLTGNRMKTTKKDI